VAPSWPPVNLWSTVSSPDALSMYTTPQPPPSPPVAQLTPPALVVP
jgi:hypothetical protein